MKNQIDLMNITDNPIRWGGRQEGEDLMNAIRGHQIGASEEKGINECEKK